MMKHAALAVHIRSMRAALEMYRDAVDELERSNWTGDIANALRRITALHRLSTGRTTDELEQLAELPVGG